MKIMEADRKMLSIYIIFIAVFDAGTTNSCISNNSSCSDCFLACNFLSVKSQCSYVLVQSLAKASLLDNSKL